MSKIWKYDYYIKLFFIFATEYNFTCFKMYLNKSQLVKNGNNS